MHKVSATLLIIDDDEVVRESLAAYLEDSNFKVLQASTVCRACRSSKANSRTWSFAICACRRSTASN